MATFLGGLSFAQRKTRNLLRLNLKLWMDEAFITAGAYLNHEYTDESHLGYTECQLTLGNDPT